MVESAVMQVTQNHISSDQKVAIEKSATAICRRGFRVPMLALLDSGPLIPFLGSQLLWIAQPALSLFMSSYNIRQTAQLLEKPEAISIMTEYLRESDDTRNY